MSGPRRPVQLGVVNDFAIVAAGVTALLAPFREVVEVREYVGVLPSGGHLDVVLYDTFGRPDPAARLSEVVDATGAQVLVYAWAVHPDQLRVAMRAGAVGFLPKTASSRTILDTVLAAASGRPVPAPALDPESEAMEAYPGQHHGLTARESEIVALIVAGLSNQEVADTCYLSINSVKTYIRTAYRRMGVTSRAQAVLWGLDHGFRPADPQAMRRAPQHR